MRGNAIEITLGYGRVGQTGNLFQYDKGQHLIINGCPLPNAYEVHFSNDTLGKSKTMLGNPEGVDIPDEYLESGEDIHVWVYIVGEDHSETEYHGVIYVTKRAEPTDETPTPSQQSVIDQTIAALNSAVTDVEHAVDTVDNKIDEALAEAKASGEFDGHTPEKGVDYWTNSDKQEITQYVSGELIDDTAGAGVTGKTWSANKIVQTLDNIPLIDDTAGAGVTDKAWSANKLTEELSEKAPVENPAFSGTFKTGEGTISNGPNAVVFGEYNVEDNLNRWPEWTPGRYNVGDKVKRTVNGKASGWICNTANTDSVFLERKWDYQGTRFNFAEIVGNGVEEKPSNARATDWQGNGFYKGDVYVGCNDNSTGGEKLPRSADVNELIQNAIRNIKSFDTKVVNRLPDYNIDLHTIYFVPKSNASTDVYNEYMYINNRWELIGSTDIDISGKVDKLNAEMLGSISMGRTGTVGEESVALGINVQASGRAAVSIGNGAIASGGSSAAFGSATEASGHGALAEGFSTDAIGDYSHAENRSTVASGEASHAQGVNTTASGAYGHSEGNGTTASGVGSHAQGGFAVASGDYSDASGYNTIAKQDYQHVFGKYNVEDNDGLYAEIVGNGVVDQFLSVLRSNARTLDWNGNEALKGDLTINAGSQYETSVGALVTAVSRKYDSTNVATVAETELIISEYGEEDEGMVVESTFNINPNDNYDVYFETTDTVTDIVNAYKQGKNVVIKCAYSNLSETYGIENDVYVTMVGYEDAAGTNEQNFYFSTNGIDNSSGSHGANTLLNVQIVNNKLRLQVYVD